MTVHGWFWQRFNDHVYNKSGCQKCPKSTDLTQDIAIQNAIKVHGSDCDYSDTIFKGSVNKMKIKCNKNNSHVYFYQTYNSHVDRKTGCPKCNTHNAISKEEALRRCQEKHKEKNYDYGFFDYIGNHKNVRIVCHEIDNGTEHGIFEKPYIRFVKGEGCLKCSKKETSKRMRGNLLDLKDQANKIHDNFYDYSLITEENFISTSHKSSIICPVDGVFQQSLAHHIYNQTGCRKCSNRKQTGKLEEIIEQSNERHEGKYDYSLITEYTKNSIVYPIICKATGEIFYQCFNNHINRGDGCPCCRDSLGEKLIVKILKNVNINFKRQKSYENCRYVKKLRFDFYIPDKNILIEFDGWQHFIVNYYFGGEEMFNILEIKDEIKNKYCEDNNITLIRIPYWLLDTPEEIEEILLNDLKNN